MKGFMDLDAFAKTLISKGYDGYFHTDGGYPDKLKMSIARYLEACKDGSENPVAHDSFSLRTFLEWKGERAPRVECTMKVRYRDGLFNVEKMLIEKSDRYGQLLKKAEQNGLTTASLPNRCEAINQISNPIQNEPTARKRFRVR